MTRRYKDVEPKLVVDLRPGDQYLTVLTVVRVTTGAATIEVEWDNGLAEIYDPAVFPAIEIVTPKDG